VPRATSNIDLASALSDTPKLRSVGVDNSPKESRLNSSLRRIRNLRAIIPLSAHASAFMRRQGEKGAKVAARSRAALASGNRARDLFTIFYELASCRLEGIANRDVNVPVGSRYWEVNVQKSPTKAWRESSGSEENGGRSIADKSDVRINDRRTRLHALPR